LGRIKTRQSIKDIKVLDKASLVSQRMKKALIRSKDQAQNLLDDGQVSPSEYAEDQIRYAAGDTAKEAGRAASSMAKKAVEKGRDAFRQHREESRLRKDGERFSGSEPESRQEDAPPSVPRESPPPTEGHADTSAHSREDQPAAQNRNAAVRKQAAYSRNRTIRTAERETRSIRESARSTGEQTIKTGAKGSVKSSERTVKTAEQTSKAAIKTAEAASRAAKKAAETSAKTAHKAAEAARQTAAAAYKAAIVAARAVSAAVKAIIAAAQKLAAAIAAGGWVAVIIVVVICLIGLIVGSCFGIFFSSEDTGSEQTMRQVVQEIDQDYQNQLDGIKAGTQYDELEMSGSRAVWPEVLSVYAVRTTTDPEHPQEVATMTAEKKQLLKDIFWQMNEISWRTETKTEAVTTETDDGHGNIVETKTDETRVTLYITVSHKTAEEMAAQYAFTDGQKEQLAELLADENRSAWTAVLYGVYGADDQIVTVALSQIGNVGGETYWSWYGFNSRVEWCACFVSWCADQCGYLESGVIPKYAGCDSGVQWFKDRGKWADGSAVPEPGMIVFFDWDNRGSSGPQDGQADHTGIVEKVEDGVVYTVEGNTGDSCAERRYSIGHYEILGYGIPAY